ncbi:MAG: LamG domain-containing protein [Gammaproteobacteria bacterium]|nr:LamG domain-containing protein [Gammaproteobacteria bacterium]
MFINNNNVSANILPLSNIILEYKFEDNLLDTVGNTDGISYGAVTFEDSKVNRGVNLDSGGILTNKKDLVGGKAQFSMSLLIKWSDISSGQAIYGSWQTPHLILFRLSNQQIQVALRNDSQTQANGFYHTITDINTWYHIVVTYNGSFIRVYLNGVNSTTEMPLTGNLESTPTEYEKIGGYGNSNYAEYTHIDCFRIWDVALSQEEATELATRELNGEDIN